MDVCNQIPPFIGLGFHQVHKQEGMETDKLTDTTSISLKGPKRRRLELDTKRPYLKDDIWQVNLIDVPNDVGRPPALVCSSRGTNET